MEARDGAKMRILCLHGFRTSGRILKMQISKWDPSIFAHFDMDFPNGIFPARGKPDIEGTFPPPYFEWFQYKKDFTRVWNFKKSIDYLCEYITRNGPFDGLLGFSQVYIHINLFFFSCHYFASSYSCETRLLLDEKEGFHWNHERKYKGAVLSAILLRCQAQGKMLKDHPTMKLFISISGGKFKVLSMYEVAFKDPITVKSVHLIGDKDWMKPYSEELVTSFQNPLIIRHPEGHTVPMLDENVVQKLRKWTMEILLSRNATSADSEGKTMKNEEEVKPKENSKGETYEIKATTRNGIAMEKREPEVWEIVGSKL